MPLARVARWLVPLLLLGPDGCAGVADKHASCPQWASSGECKANPSFMLTECAAACKLTGSQVSAPLHNNDPHCGEWAEKGECERNPSFMMSGCGKACADRVERRKDKSPECATWAAEGKCDSDFARMRQRCWTSCERALDDTLPTPECRQLVGSGGCATADGLGRCRQSCRTSLTSNLTEDKDGNCWYWATDGECNNEHMQRTTCPRSCAKLAACRADPSSAEYAAAALAFPPSEPPPTVHAMPMST